MSVSLQQIEADALGLPANERARLAHRLIQSLDEEIEDPAEAERAWQAEIQLRLDEYRAGKVQTTPAADVFSEARRRLR
jgi:putative addiction module component (TIGR02574 family)